MEPPKNTRRGAQLMMAAGLMFFVAAVIGKQIAFYGVGAAFLAIGASQLRKLKQGKPEEPPV